MWKELDNYNGNYFISDEGDIKNRQGLVLKPAKQSKGYLSVVLSFNDKRVTQLVHRLVAQHFIPNPLNLPQVNHKDGVKTNNNKDNLEWTNSSDNLKHAYSIGIKSAKGDKNSNSKLTEEQVSEIRRRKKSESLKDLAQEYNISYDYIRKISCGSRR